jgi:hypothetical protein
MTGGDLHWIWEPYTLQEQVDRVCANFNSHSLRYNSMLTGSRFTAAILLRMGMASRTPQVCSPHDCSTLSRSHSLKRS